MWWQITIGILAAKFIDGFLGKIIVDLLKMYRKKKEETETISQETIANGVKEGKKSDVDYDKPRNFIGFR